MQKTIKPNMPKRGNGSDVLAVMGISFAWSGLVVLLSGLFYFLQGVLNIGYEYVMETGADGETMWRVIPPGLDLAFTVGILLVTALLYWSAKRKKQLCAGAFSLKRLRPYAKGIALVTLCYVARALLHAMNGDLNLRLADGIADVLLGALVVLAAALYNMLLAEGKAIGYLRGKGRSDEVVVRVMAQETLVMGILSMLTGAANAYLNGSSVGVAGVQELLSLATGIAFVVMCSRIYLASGSMMGRGIFQIASVLFSAQAASYTIWHFVADAVVLMSMCAAIRMFKENAGRCENGLTS